MASGYIRKLGADPGFHLPVTGRHVEVIGARPANEQVTWPGWDDHREGPVGPAYGLDLRQREVFRVVPVRLVVRDTRGHGRTRRLLGQLASHHDAAP